MKKKKNIIIIAAVIVLVLAVVMIFVLQIPEKEGNVISSDTLDILLYNKTSQKAEDITVKNSSGEYQLLGYDYTKLADELSEENAENESSSENSTTNKYVTDTSIISINTRYTIQGLEDFELDQDYTNELAYNCMYITALQIVDKTGQKYSEYGLDKPQTTVKIIFSDNSEETLYIGNKAPNDAGYYFRREGDKNVYLLNSDTVRPFLRSKFDYLSKSITREYEEDDYKPDEEQVKFTVLSVGGTIFDKPLEIDRADDISILSEYTMRSPYHIPAASTEVNSFSKSLFGLTADAVVSAGESDELKKELSKYGLDKPYMNINVKMSDNSEISLIVSKADDKGICYIMTDDGDRIFSVKESDIDKWYKVKSEDFMTLSITSFKIDNMTKAVVTANDNTTEYHLEHDIKENEAFEEYANIKITADGEDISYENFSVFIDNIDGLRRIGIDVENADDAEELLKAEFSFEDRDNNKENDVLSLRKFKDGRYVVVLNDTVMAYTNAEYAEKLVEQADSVKSDEKIQTIKISDESSENSEQNSDADDDNSKE